MPTIVDIAVNTEGFSTLVAAVQAAGLVETLQSAGLLQNSGHKRRIVLVV